MPVRSIKRKRLFLINEYYELKDIKSYIYENNIVKNKAWMLFIKKLNSKDDDIVH